MSSTTVTSSTDASFNDDAQVIGLVGLAHGTSHFFHLLLPPLFPWLMRDFGLSFTQAGFLMTVFFVVSGIGQATAGFIVDRHGARPVLLFGIATLALSGVVLAVASSYSMLLLTAVIAGTGNSIFHPADFTLLNRRVRPKRLGHAFSVHGLTGNLGWAAAPVLLVPVAQIYGWRSAGWVAASVALFTLTVLLLRRRTLAEVSSTAVVAPTAASATPPAKNSRFGFLASSAVWMCLLFFFFSTAAFGVLQNFGPAIFQTLYHLPATTAAMTVTTYMLGSAAGIVTGGFLAAHTKANECVIGTALGAAALIALLLSLVVVPSAMVFPLVVLMGFGVGIAGPNRDLLVRHAATSRFGGASYGRVYGFVYSGLDLGLATSPLVLGPLLDAGHFQAALVVLAVLNAAAILTAFTVARQRVTAVAA